NLGARRPLQDAVGEVDRGLQVPGLGPADEGVNDLGQGIDDALLDRLERLGILQGPRLRARHASGPRSKLQIRTKTRTMVLAVRSAQPPRIIPTPHAAGRRSGGKRIQSGDAVFRPRRQMRPSLLRGRWGWLIWVLVFSGSSPEPHWPPLQLGRPPLLIAWL